MLNYFKFIKIEHTLFSLPIVFAGTFLALSQFAQQSLPLKEFLWIFLAVLGARSFGFGVNRIVDKSIDAENPRTKEREIPSGKISIKSALVFVVLSGTIYLVSSAMLSRLCFLLSPIPLVLFSVYPFLKRWTIWSHLGLGIAWGIAPIGGWLAVRPQLNLTQMVPVLLLSLFCVFWVGGFDIVYSLLDEEFDREKKLFSMPAVLGNKNALRVSEIFHAVAIIFLGTLVQTDLNHPLAFIFLAVITILLMLSHWKVQVQPLTPPLIDFAFFKVNAALGFIVFLLIIF